MKKINFRLSGLFVLFLCIFSNQVVFADIIIRKDDPAPGTSPNVYSSARTFSLSSTSLISVTADLIGTDLVVDFNSTVGTAFVSVVDNNGNVVYQTTVDTFSSPELVIPVDTFEKGKYSLKISYGSTKLIGDFKL
jgi:hypothetical protein